MTANTGRKDYDTTVKMAVPLQEPTFILRGQDELAAQTIRHWVQLATEAGVDTAVIEQALSQADAMDAWPIHKLPTAEHLTDDDAKQLRYRYQRRAHRTLHGFPGPQLGSERLSTVEERRGVSDLPEGQEC